MMLRRLSFFTHAFLALFSLLATFVSYLYPWGVWLKYAQFWQWPALTAFPCAYAIGAPFYLFAVYEDDFSSATNIALGAFFACMAGVVGWFGGEALLYSGGYYAFFAFHAGATGVSVYVLVFTTIQLWPRSTKAFRRI